MRGLTSPIKKHTPPRLVAIAVAVLGSGGCETSQCTLSELTPEKANAIRQAAGRSDLEVTAPGVHGVPTDGRISRVLETEVLVDLQTPPAKLE